MPSDRQKNNLSRHGSADSINGGNKSRRPGEAVVAALFAEIAEAVGEIDFGSVQIHIQDRRVVQIDKISKIRMR